MIKILLQPSSGKEAMEHFEDTIAQGQPLDFIKSYLSEEESKKVSELGEQYVKIWGMVPEEKNKPRPEWSNLNEGDWVLFYAKKGFYYIAKVHSKIHNAELSKTLWGFDKNGKTWEYIYFIKEGKQIQIPYNPEILKKADGERYKNNHVVQGAILLDKTNSERMKAYVENYEGEIVDEDQIEPNESEEVALIKKTSELKTPEDAEKEINKISTDIANNPVKERIRTAKILSRNSKFSRLTKERVRYKCEMCGQIPFMQKNGLPYAEAHHKFELSKSRIDNPHNMICVCPTCHKAIHYGNDNALEERKKLKLGKI